MAPELPGKSLLATLLTLLVLSLPGASAAQSILIFDDTPALEESAMAAERISSDFVSVRNITAFVDAWHGREHWDLLVIDLARTVFTPTLIDLVEIHLEAGGALLVSHFNLDANEQLRDVLDLDCLGDPVDFSVFTEPGALFDPFDFHNSLSRPLHGRAQHPDNGDHCISRSGGRVLASTFAPAELPVFVTTRNNQVLYSALVFDSLRPGYDPSGELTSEIIENLMRITLELQRPRILTLGDEAFWTNFASETGWRVEISHTTADLQAAADQFQYRAVAITGELTPELQTLLPGLPVPALYFPTALAPDSPWLEFLDVELAPTTPLAGLEPGLSVFSTAFFNTPWPMDGLVVERVPETEIQALQAPPGGLVLARFESGEAALIAGDQGAWAVAPFLPGELGGDAGSDLTAGSAWVLNLLNTLDGLADGEPVLLYSSLPHDVPSPLLDAARSAGFNPLRIHSPTLLQDALAGDDVVLLLLEDLDGTIGFLDAPAFLQALDLWLNDDRPVVYAGTGLSSAPAAAALLGLNATAHTGDSRLRRSISHLGQIFNTPTAVPTELPPLSSACSPCSMALAPGADGAVAATFEDGAPALTTSRNGRVVALGLDLRADHFIDTDRDRRADLDQLLEALMHAALTPMSAHILAQGAAVTPLVQATNRAGLRALQTDTVEGLADFSDLPALRIVDESVQAYTQSPELQTLLLNPNDISVILFSPAPSPALLSSFGALGTTPLTDHEALVEPMTGHSDLFRVPLLVPSPLMPPAPGGGAWASALLPQTNVPVLARWGTNLGEAALLSTRSGRSVLAGFGVDSLPLNDRNADGVADGVAFLANLFIRRGTYPFARIAGPDLMEESGVVTLDASSSFDPLSQGLTYRWDLDGDGVFDDASGPHADILGFLYDGPAIITIGVEIETRRGDASRAWHDIFIHNSAPQIDAGGDRTHHQGQTPVFQVDIVDSLRETFLVVWDFGDGQTDIGQTVTHIWEEIGGYLVHVHVSDGDGGEAEAWFTVTWENTAPLVELNAPTEVQQGDTVVMSVNATDPGDDALTYLWSFSDGMTATTATVERSFLQADETVTLTLAVQDIHGAVTQVVHDIRVHNLPPVFLSSPPLSAALGREYTYQAGAQDPGGDTYTWSLPQAPAGMTVSATGLVKWTVPPTRLAPYPITLRVTDAAGASAEQSWELVITAVDTDGGGAPDLCELFYGFDPNNPSDDHVDADGDGISLADECWLGTNPHEYSGPEAPVLVSPIEGATWRFDTLTLILENSENPSRQPLRYQFELYLDETLEHLVAEVPEVVEHSSGQTVVTLDPSWIEDQRYYWRARAYSDFSEGPWSDAEHFVYNARNRAPGTPTPIYPVVWGAENPPLFRIQNAMDPDGEVLSYEFELFRNTSLREEDRIWQSPPVPQGSGGQTEVQTGTALPEGGVYAWRVRARDPLGGIGPFASATFTLDTSNLPPSPPVLVSPIGGEILPSNREVELVWEHSEDPNDDLVTYIGELSRQADFSVLERSFTVPPSAPTEDVRLNLFSALTPNTTWYWRISASDGRLRSAWAHDHFEIGPPIHNVPPTVPEPISPLAGENFEDNEAVTLVIQNSTDANGDPIRYHFEVALDVTMRDIVFTFRDVNQGSGSTTSVGLGELPPMTYFWRVRASDGMAVSLWSPVRGFSIFGDAVPDISEPDDSGGDDVGGDVGNLPPRPTRGDLGGGGGCSVSQAPSTKPALVLLLLSFFLIRRRGRRRSV